MVRQARRDDLSGLLALYEALHGEPPPPITPRLQAAWDAMLCREGRHVIVAQEGEGLVSSCVLDILPNLTRGQRPYALVENVVTAPAFRRRGLGTACLEMARALAAAENCYKIMLLTGSKEEATLRFYERAGYQRGGKTAFIRWLD